MAITIGEALYEEAQRSLLSKLKLTDWRLGEQDEADPVPFAVEVEVESDRIDLTVFDHDNAVIGHIWLEMEGSKLVAHAYDREHDEPVNLHITADHILIDTRDRELSAAPTVVSR